MASNKAVLFILLIVLSFNSFAAEEISFDEEELPKEAVMPRLDTPDAVLNRKLSYQNRFQVDLGFGWLLDEAFYNNQFVSFQSSYGFNEASGFGIRYLSFRSGFSEYADQISSISSTNPPSFDTGIGPKSGLIGYYERRMMYGKMSVSKHYIIPGFMIWNVEAGTISYGSKSLPLAGGSIGSRLFPMKNLGITLNLRGYIRQFVDPLSQDLRTGTQPAESGYSTNTKFSTMLDFTINYLF